MADNDVRTKILDIQVRYQDALDKIAKYRKEVADAMARQKDLKKELDAGSISKKSQSQIWLAAFTKNCLGMEENMKLPLFSLSMIAGK